MVNMVLFSPGSVRRPYTNTGFSEKVKTFQVSPSFVLYLQEQEIGKGARGMSCLLQGTLCHPQPEQQGQFLCPDTHLSWSVSVPWAMATRIPPWSPQV